MKNAQRVGETNRNKHGALMTIIEYKNSDNIVVLFENGRTKKCTYNSFKKGEVRDRYEPIVCGVGIIGDGKSIENGKYSKEYELWRAMIKRCYSNSKVYSAYNDVSVCDEWLYYPNFYNWLINQENYPKLMDEANPQRAFCLDKDILRNGDKVYSPQTCLIVPQEINNIFKDSKKRRGKLPLGVSLKKKNGKEYIRFRVCLGKGQQIERICSTVEDAFANYKYYKEKYVKELAIKHFNNGNITRKCYEALMRFEVKITD